MNMADTLRYHHRQLGQINVCVYYKDPSSSSSCATAMSSTNCPIRANSSWASSLSPSSLKLTSSSPPSPKSPISSGPSSATADPDGSVKSCDRIPRVVEPEYPGIAMMALSHLR